MEAVGGKLTLTVTCAVFEQPFESIPVTVYVVVLVGLTLYVCPTPRP